MINLADWHANPLPEGEAQARLARLRTATAWDDRLEVLRLRLMLGLPAEMQRDVLWSEATDDRHRAAVELITGQVMLTQRLNGAWAWLDSAEKRLAHVLPGPGYLELLQRHAALKGLRLFERPKTMRPLAELQGIAEATSHIEDLRRGEYVMDQRDTIG